MHNNIYDKCDRFDFPITNTLFLSYNVPRSPAYSVARSNENLLAVFYNKDGKL